MRITSLALRIMRQLLRDRRTLALFFLAPALILGLLWTVLASAKPTPRLVATGLPSALVQSLQPLTHLHSEPAGMAQRSLASGRTDAWLAKTGDHRYVLTMVSVNPAITARVKVLVSAALAADHLRAAMASLPMRAGSRPDAALHPPALVVRYRYPGSTFSAFNQLAPALLALFIFFFAFLVPGIAFLRERAGGTLDRLLASPLRPGELVLGYLTGFGLFAVLQTAFIQAFGAWVLGIQSAGAFTLVVLVGLLIALTALSLGMALSAFARTEFQIMQFIPLVILPQIAFSGLFSLRSAPSWTRYLSEVLPLTYGIAALKKVMLEGASLHGVLGDLAVLSLFLVAFLTLNLVFLRLKPGGE